MSSVQILRAVIYDQTGRYDEMMDCVDRIVKDDAGNNRQARTLFMDAYHKAIETRRKARRVLLQIADEKRMAGKKTALAHTEDYIRDIESEIKRLCQRGLKICEDFLGKKTTPIERAFSLKATADFLRYMAEIDGGQREKTEAAYTKAAEVASSLGYHQDEGLKGAIALNQAIFYKEVMRNVGRALEIANAVIEADYGVTNTPRDQSLILTLLRRNVAVWKQEA